MGKKIKLNYLAAAIVLISGGIYGLYAGLVDGFNGFYFIPSCVFVLLGVIYARNIRKR